MKALVVTVIMSITMAGSTFSQDTTEVLMENFKFSPDTITVQKGEVVKWIQNVDGTPHNTVSGTISGGDCSPDSLWESPLYSDKGKTFSFKFDTVGAFSYYCEPHCGIEMYGLVTVEDPSTGIADKSESLNVKAYPNPVQNRLKVVTNLSDVTNVKLSVINMQGRVLKEASYQNLNGKQSLNVDMRRMPAGSYFLRIRTNDQAVRKIFIKQ